MSKSLKAKQHQYTDSIIQLDVLNQPPVEKIPKFKDKLFENGLYPLKPTSIEIFQVNIGKMCNQTCKHCHVDAGPDRKEIMTKETMEKCLAAIENSNIETIDITGGAPEMNPNFRWFVEQCFKMKKHIIVRCNLTIILANPVYHDLPDFYRSHKVEIVSSLPHFSALRTNAQRGKGVFEKSVEALQMLNQAGYGKNDSDLILDLVYNPGGAFLPPSQQSLERDFKQKLKKEYNIDFNNLFTITNMPISRFLDYLVQSGKYEEYMEKLVNAFNPSAAANVMCRNTISIGWDGAVYDCDFNQMLDLKVDKNAPQYIDEFDINDLQERKIVIDQHCYGCTAGAGSSCGGEIA